MHGIGREATQRELEFRNPIMDFDVDAAGLAAKTVRSGRGACRGQSKTVVDGSRDRTGSTRRDRRDKKRGCRYKELSHGVLPRPAGLDRRAYHYALRIKFGPNRR